MGELVSRVESETGLSAVHVDPWFKLREGKAARAFNDMISVIAQSSFVISDTYHFCVNGLNIGVPVVALGKHTVKQSGTLGDHKKRTLFEMLGLEDQYITTSHAMVDDDFAGKVISAVDGARFDCYDNQRVVINRIHSFRTRLERDISSLLQEPAPERRPIAAS